MSNGRSGRFGIPVPDWIRDYQKEWIRWDVIAGLTAAAVVIPKAMAYATIAGLPVQVGLYTAFLPMVIYAVLGTSRPLSVSTTTTLAILAAATLGEAIPDGSPASLLTGSATLTLLVGVVLVLAALLRLGFVANFISDPVLIGFKAGIGLVIVLDQVPKLLGIHFPKGAFSTMPWQSSEASRMRRWRRSPWALPWWESWCRSNIGCPARQRRSSQSAAGSAV
jgi:SulP family sulfate permease